MKLSNLALYTISNSIMHLGWGLVGPFYYLYINQIGGSIEEFGIAFGIMTFVSSLGAIFAGKYSDILGRKPFLLGISILYSITIFSYTLISSVIELYVLQAVFGVLLAIEETVHPTFLGDITKRSKRGFQLGIYRFIVGMFSGSAIMLGGLLVGQAGFKIIFYIGAVLIALGTLVLFALKETVRRRR